MISFEKTSYNQPDDYRLTENKKSRYKYNILNQLSKIVTVVLLALILSIAIIACSEERVPTFLDINYIYSMEGAEVLEIIDADREITWFATFDTFPLYRQRTLEAVHFNIMRHYGVELPDSFFDINLDSNSFIAITIGRRLSSLHYYDDARGRDGKTGHIIARPIFEREYFPSTIFIYQVSPLPRNVFACEWDGTDNYLQFIINGNVPFEN
jgi:hypothetical protein